MNKLISVIVSAVMAVSGIQFTSLANIVDTAFSAVTGVPLLSSSINSKFLDDISNDDISPLSDSNGFCRNLVMLFISDDVSTVAKIRFFRDESLVLLGWSCPGDLYIAATSASNYNELNALCDKLMTENDIISYACPVTAKKISPDSTPNDPFDTTEGEVNDWNELNPDGANWWLETIDARRAWDYDDYCSEIRIGVCDCGFESFHEDLEDRIYFPNRLQLFLNNAEYHGDHVAGIIAAKRNNGKGIAGIVDKAKLVCVDWEPSPLQLWITDLHIMFGFIDLVKADCKVINFSLGCAGAIKGGSSSKKNMVDADILVYSALISALLAKGYDFICVQSAGNGNGNQEPVDAYYNGTFTCITAENAYSIEKGISGKDIADRIMVVSAIANKIEGEDFYRQTNYSNVGSQVSIAAPGDDVFSCGLFTDEYYYNSGTSMSTPVVTGVAALVWSINPSFTGAQVKNIVCADNSSKEKAVPTEKRKFKDLNYMDYNIVNAGLAVENALCQSYDMGRVSGIIADDNGALCSDVVLTQGEKTVAFTVLPDGSFSFVAPQGNAVISAKSSEGSEIFTKEITIVKDSVIDIGNPVADLTE